MTRGDYFPETVHLVTIAYRIAIMAHLLEASFVWERAGWIIIASLNLTWPSCATGLVMEFREEEARKKAEEAFRCLIPEGIGNKEEAEDNEHI